jgi:hypothetical protein
MKSIVLSDSSPREEWTGGIMIQSELITVKGRWRKDRVKNEPPKGCCLFVLLYNHLKEQSGKYSFTTGIEDICKGIKNS